MLDQVKKPNYRKVSEKVADIHDQFGITEPPVNPVMIAKSLGLDVFFVTFSGDSNRISGFLDVKDNAIYVNSAEYPLRQTFTIAHELGHAVLHQEWARSDNYEILFRDSGYGSDDPYEKEANVFAANLLVPRFMLEKYWKNNSSESLSRLFAVSVPMIKNRLANEYGV